MLIGLLIFRRQLVIMTNYPVCSAFGIGFCLEFPLHPREKFHIQSPVFPEIPAVLQEKCHCTTEKPSPFGCADTFGTRINASGRKSVLCKGTAGKAPLSKKVFSSFRKYALTFSPEQAARQFRKPSSSISGSKRSLLSAKFPFHGIFLKSVDLMVLFTVNRMES